MHFSKIIKPKLNFIFDKTIDFEHFINSIMKFSYKGNSLSPF